MSALNRRRAIALTALAGLFLATYMFLHALGFYGALVCGGSGGCSAVQASTYARFLGFSVAGWGVGWYAAVLFVSLAAVLGGQGGKWWVSLGLVVLSTGGVLFTAYLKALELWVIHAICRWCVGSAILAAIIFLLSLPEWRRVRGGLAVE